MHRTQILISAYDIKPLTFLYIMGQWQWICELHLSLYAVIPEDHW